MAAQGLVESFGVSERRACRAAGLSRATLRYRPRRAPRGDLIAAIRGVAYEYPRWGYRQVADQVRGAGFRVGTGQVYRLYRAEGLAVRRRRRKRLNRQERRPLPRPSRLNERWSMDFVHDQLANGRRFRAFCVIDDHSRESLAIEADTSLSGTRVARVLTRLCMERGRPNSIVCDNGTEFRSRALNVWASKQNIALDFIEPGKPQQNAFVESFNGTFRNECLNAHWFQSLDHARVVIAQWQQIYNTIRTHSSLGRVPPAAFAQASCQQLSTEVSVS